jgi:hypothetical protein
MTLPWVKDIVDPNDEYDFMPTHGHRYQRHRKGVINKIYRINEPDKVRVGNCFMKDRLKEGDLVLCVKHSGDCFQDFQFVEISKWFEAKLFTYEVSKIECEFGAYESFGAMEEILELTEQEAAVLMSPMFGKDQRINVTERVKDKLDRI